MNDLLISAENYLERAKPELMILAQAFSEESTKDIWSDLEQLLEGIQWLDDMLKVIDSAKKHPSNWVSYKKHEVVMQD